MEVSPGTRPAHFMSADSRLPLFPIALPSTNIPGKQVRRKSSFATKIDSSEDAPSPHNSIFEALCTSPHNSEDAPLSNQTSMTVPNTAGKTENTKLVGQFSRDTIDDSGFRYGHGTVLDTITEQKSSGTMRTVTEGEQKIDLPEFPLIRHPDSLTLDHSSRRKQAFSLDDLALIKSAYHDACTIIERVADKSPLNAHIYAEPQIPVQAPLKRPATPEGMPSWTASQNAPPRQHRPIQQVEAPQSRLQRFLHTLHISRKPKDRVIASHSVLDPIRARQAPRFRPPRSVYGVLEQHPFNSAPIAAVLTRPVVSPQPSSIKGKNKSKSRGSLGVRFTPSATARDSEINTLVTAIETTNNNAPHPIQPFHVSSHQTPPLNIKCPHSKGRKAIAGSVGQHQQSHTNPPSFEYVIDPPLSTTTIDGHSLVTSTGQASSNFNMSHSNYSGLVIERSIGEAPSISSTTHLMSGGLGQSQTSLSRYESGQPALNSSLNDMNMKVVKCWRCKADNGRKRLDEWTKRSAEFLYFMCCGCDSKVETGTEGPRSESDLRGPRIAFS